MEENKSISVNGVEFTPEMLKRLKDWNIGEENGEIDNMLKVLVNIQDYLCERIWDAYDKSADKEKQCIADVMYLKNELKPFAYNQ